MKINNNYIIANNVAIVQSPECVEQLPEMLKADDLQNYFGTVFLAVVNSIPTTEDEITSVKSLFWSWFESGNEDQHLEELYKSRLIPSIPPRE